MVVRNFFLLMLTIPLAVGCRDSIPTGVVLPSGAQPVEAASDPDLKPPVAAEPESPEIDSPQFALVEFTVVEGSQIVISTSLEDGEKVRVQVKQTYLEPIANPTSEKGKQIIAAEEQFRKTFHDGDVKVQNSRIKFDAPKGGRGLFEMRIYHESSKDPIFVQPFSVDKKDN